MPSGEKHIPRTFTMYMGSSNGVVDVWAVQGAALFCGGLDKGTICQARVPSAGVDRWGYECRGGVEIFVRIG